MQENLNKKFIGEVIDTIIDSKTGERKTIKQGHNLVVASCSTLIAMLMKGDGKPIAYLAVGSGADNWDDSNLPNPSESDTKLLKETFRKAISPNNISYLDTDNVVTTTPTNKIQIVVTFDEAEANGALRELGLFGGDATDILNSGTMLNRKIHSSIYKTNAMKLERTIRITF